MAREYRVEIAGLANPLRLQENDRSVACDYRHTGRTAAASEAFKKAIEYDPEMAEAYYQLGISFFGSADTMKEAIPVLQKYLEMVPDGPNSEAAKQLIVAAGGI